MRAKSVIIIGGGLAGLTAALVLKRAGFEVTLIEKKDYPFHRVCGEYISNEVLPFFSSLDIDVQAMQASKINRLVISSVAGKTFSTQLDLGGFGLSRYTLDHFLFKKAINEGVNIITGTKAESIQYLGDSFEISLGDSTQLHAGYVISAHGKRSNLDKDRSFFQAKSPYLGVKYHVKSDFPIDTVQLDNFEGGYCGTVKIEGDRYNICYLVKNHHLKTYGSISEMEANILFQNPILRHRFENSDRLTEKPEVINEISFQKKPLVENHVLYCGDSAGMISPLCGNGMAMAIHSAKVLSDTIITHHSNRDLLEKTYQRAWSQLFENRLRVGRITQKLFGHKSLSNLAVKALNFSPEISHLIMKQTHGKSF